MANINEFINTAKELADLAGKKATAKFKKHMKNWVLSFINSAKAGKKTTN